MALQQHHVVLSTALHDFQGLSILEATILGCIPLVPDRLAYQEYVPSDFRYRSNPSNPREEALDVISKLERLSDLLVLNNLPKPPNLERLSAVELAPQYRALFHALLAGPETT